MNTDSLLTGENASFVELLYSRWLTDPDSVEPAWRALFEQYERPTPQNGHLPGEGPTFRARSIFNPPGAVDGPTGAAIEAAARRQTKVVQLINAYRVRGHMEAGIDPLARRETELHPELTLEYHGLTEADLDAVVPTAPLFGVPELLPLRDIIAHLRNTYCRCIGAEFMNINDLEEKLWVQEQLETLPNRRVLDKEHELRVLRKLSDAENFEAMLHTRFPGTKRFSLEGAETLIPLLDLVVDNAASHGVREMVIGMAHRGRLNVLANILEKPVRIIVEEFEDTKGLSQGSGDVKYHLGYSSDVRTTAGEQVHMNLCFNPSHLEAVDPVVLGRVRAKQDRAGDWDRRCAMSLMIHGDAAFAGQGLVAEILNMSELHGYRTGGTVHVIVNNQIGFTTAPHEARSTPYATDVARMLAVPIFHVNGENPRAVAAVVQIATAWRHRFGRDVVIDMYCYRKHGHNEGDEPSFTQPLMYEQIRSRPTPRQVYAQRLVEAGDLDEADVERIRAESREALEQQLQVPDPAPVASGKGDVETKDVVDDAAILSDKRIETAVAGQRDEASESPMKGLWSRYRGDIEDEIDTSFPVDRLRELLFKATEVPDDFQPHAKIKRLHKQRREMIEGKRGMDWALGEQAAFASLVDEGVRVRLAGQDSGRGTFSQRHAILTDTRTGREYFPLQHLSEDQAYFRVIDTMLSEAGILGFEFGYSLDTPDALVLWEAQFGDFANGAQVIIDQFITSSEQKWNRHSGLVMLLPHGYEGQGPEHSSARIERYLQQCAQDNMQVANCTTPANLFHLLRRQALRRVRKPLVLATPKSLLRHPLATNSLEEIATGSFQRVIGEVDDLDPAGVRRIVFCSGKVYYDLFAERRERGVTDVALVRLELLYPYPRAAVAEVVAAYPNATDLVWCQEEPKNMGAWTHVYFAALEHLPRPLRYVGREAAASPATGSNRHHRATQAELVAAALTISG